MHTPYIDGVTNQDGEQVIRPLSKEEKEFINKFDNEFGNAAFNNDPTDLHYKLIQDNKSEVKRLKLKLKKVSAEIRKFTHGEGNGYREMSSEERLDYKEYQKNLFLKKNDIAQQLEKVNVRGNIDNSKNGRRKDVSNSSRTSNISDLATGNFIYIDGDSILSSSSESSLFDRLKAPPIVED